MIRTKSKQEKIGQLIKRVDEVVSLYVRLSAADQNGTVRCISCDEKFFWKDVDCAHFKDRDNMATRFYLPNLAPGCKDCNRFNHYEHIEAWEKKLTPEMITHLNFIAHGMQKYTRVELEEIHKEFTQKYIELKKQKGI